MYRQVLRVILIMSLLVLPLLGTCLIRDSKPLEEEVKFAVDPAFLIHYDGLSSFEETYGLKFDGVYEMVIGLTHEAIRQEDVDVGMGFTTDGKIKELDLVPLEDDRNFFPANNPALLVREEVLNKYPEIREVSGQLSSLLHAETMIYLNYLVDIKEREPFDVACNLLLEEGMISSIPERSFDDSSMSIGSMAYTEHQILTNLMMIALLYRGIPVVEKRYLLPTTEALRIDTLEGSIEMYWEYLTNGWEQLFEEEEEPSKDSRELFLQVAGEDAANDLIWVDYMPFRSTYTIIMRSEQARELDIQTISDLAAWLEEMRE